MARRHIPTRVDEITPAWLTAALRERGVLGTAQIEAVEAESLGEGEGFVGRIACLHLRFDRPEPGLPQTLIAKLPTSVRSNRAAGELLGLYEREILFYEELAAHVALRTPRIYYAALDPNPGSQYGPAIVRFLEGQPAWLLSPQLALYGWLAGLSRRRYLLLMEDLRPARLGDHVAGCESRTARRALRALARAHASLWQSGLLREQHWLYGLDATASMWQLAFRRSRPTFEARYLPRMGARVRGLLDWLDGHGVELARIFQRSAPETLLHTDYRLDNLFFDDREPENGVAAIDWQTASRGPGVFDAAYFLSTSLEPDVSEEAVHELLRAYHAELEASGVPGYDFEACRRHYEYALLLILHRMVTAEALDLGERRGVALFDASLRRVEARLRTIEPKRLLLSGDFVEY